MYAGTVLECSKQVAGSMCNIISSIKIVEKIQNIHGRAVSGNLEGTKCHKWELKGKRGRRVRIPGCTWFCFVLFCFSGHSEGWGLINLSHNEAMLTGVWPSVHSHTPEVCQSALATERINDHKAYFKLWHVILNNLGYTGVSYTQTLWKSLNSNIFQETVVEAFKNPSRKLKKNPAFRLVSFIKLGPILFKRKYIWGGQN